jgi:hypothetical protein
MRAMWQLVAKVLAGEPAARHISEGRLSRAIVLWAMVKVRGEKRTVATAA